MLGKLFKHEFKASGRVYGLLYILVAVFTFLMIVYDCIFKDFFRQIPSGWLQGFTETIAALLGIGYFVVLMAVNILTLVYLIYRFYQTMVCDEGYLTHTLPVTTGQLIIVKTVTAFCFQILSIIVTVLSVLVCIAAGGAWSEVASGLGELFSELREQGIFGTNFTVLILLAVLFAVFATVFNILTYYMCISAGNLFNSHKLLGSVVVYLVFNVVKGVITTVIMVLGAWTAEKRLDRLADGGIQDWVDSMKPSQVLGFFNSYMAAGVLIIIIGCGILFAISRYLLKNKLNLA